MCNYKIGPEIGNILGLEDISSEMAPAIPNVQIFSAPFSNMQHKGTIGSSSTVLSLMNVETINSHGTDRPAGNCKGTGDDRA
jgi:hypothetical protein